MAQELRKRYHGTEVRIASIFLRECVTHEHANFIEDFLACVYSQIFSGSDDPALAEEQPLPLDYIIACQDGNALTTRLAILRSKLRALLKSNEHNFLIVDGFDQLDAASRMILELELRNSHVHNLSLMINRRVPSFEKPQQRLRCDGCDKDPLFLYWECSACPKNMQDYCYECKEKGYLCSEGHDVSVLSEPYDRIELDMSSVQWHKISYDEGFKNPMVDWVTHELRIGMGLSEEGGSEILKKAAASVVEKADGNINMAKLRIEELLATDMGEMLGKVGDRLPRNIVAFFDAEMSRIQSQTPKLRELALLTIAAVAEREYYEGVLVATLEKMIRKARDESPHLGRFPVRSLEDILEAANGLIVMRLDTDIFGVVLWHADFATYVQENYNQTLFSMKAQLDRSAIEMEEDFEYFPHRVLSSGNILAEPSETPDEPNYASDKDSAYFSGNTSRQTSANSDLPTLGSLKITENCQGGTDLSINDPDAILSYTDPHQKPETRDKTVPKPSASDVKSLCSFCEDSIIRGIYTKGVHHSSAISLAESTARNCLFCSELYKDILQDSSSDPVAHTTLPAQEWPIYSWVMRSTGKVNNSKTSLAITFRPIDGKDNKSTGADKSRTYQILAEPDIGTIPPPEQLGVSTDPAQSRGHQLEKWMTTCTETHRDCYRRKEGEFVPTRLVDLQCENQDMVRIVHTKKEGIKTRYCTLSHSWGPPNFLQLKVENEARLMGSGVKISELSKNFQQAISVARFMGNRYIWIDSLCIRQGQGGDFEAEGQLMHLVYSYSFCNIAIADSYDGEGGLFRDRKPPDILPACYTSDGTGKLESGTWRIVREDLWKAELLGAKIYTRGWVFQGE